MWNDLMGDESYGELYFNITDVRPTKTALDGYQRIRTVGKGNVPIKINIQLFTAFES